MAKQIINKILSKYQIEHAMKHTRSNRAAARFLKVSLEHYRKFAKIYRDDLTGDTLYETHKNQAGKNIPKFLSNKGKEPALMDVLEGRVPVEHFNPDKIKQRIIFEGLIQESCKRCGYNERRIVDQKIPLILHHLNRDKKDYNLSNIEFLCYNCSFLYGNSPISEKQVKQMEDYVDIKSAEEPDWEMDEWMQDHLKDIGVDNDKDDSGEEFISYL